MAKFHWCPLALLFSIGVAVAGQPTPDKEILVQGKALSYWLKELKHPDAPARERALVALAGGGDAARTAAAPLATDLLKDPSAPVRFKAAILLSPLKGHGRKAAPVLLAAWKDGTQNQRMQILTAMGPLALEDRDALVLLIRACDDDDRSTRIQAKYILTRARPAIHGPLIKTLDHVDPVVRRQVVIHLSPAGREAAVALTRMLKDEDWETRFWAAHALVRIEKNPPAVLDLMIEGSSKNDLNVKESAVRTLVLLKAPAKEALPIYKVVLKDGPASIKVEVAEEVWRLTRKVDEVLPIYREALENAKPGENVSAARALAALTALGPDAKALRVPLLELLKKGENAFVLQGLPPILASFGPESIPALTESAGSLKSNMNSARAQNAARTLGLLGKEGVAPLLQLTQHPYLMVRINAYDALPLAGVHAKDAVPALRKALKDESTANNKTARSFALRVLGRIGPDAKEAVPDVLELARKGTLRRIALFSLPHMQPLPADVRPVLEALLDDGDPLVRLGAAEWLWRIDPTNARPAQVVVGCLKDPNTTRHAVPVLAHMGEGAKPVLPTLTEMIEGDFASQRTAAILACDGLGIRTKEHQQRLVDALDDPIAEVRVAAARALRKLGVEKKAAVTSLARTLGPLNTSIETGRLLAEFGPDAKEAVPAIERQIATAVVSRLEWIEILAAIDPAKVEKYQATLAEAAGWLGSMPATRLLGQHNPTEPRYLEAVLAKLQDSSNANHRQMAAGVLADGGAWAMNALPALRQALDDPHPGVRLQAAFALDRLEPGKHKIVPVLIGVLREKRNIAAAAQHTAADALGARGPAAMDAVPALRAAFGASGDSYFRFAVNEALWKIDPKSAFPCVFAGY